MIPRGFAGRDPADPPAFPISRYIPIGEAGPSNLAIGSVEKYIRRCDLDLSRGRDESLHRMQRCAEESRDDSTSIRKEPASSRDEEIKDQTSKDRSRSSIDRASLFRARSLAKAANGLQPLRWIRLADRHVAESIPRRDAAKLSRP